MGASDAEVSLRLSERFPKIPWSSSCAGRASPEQERRGRRTRAPSPGRLRRQVTGRRKCRFDRGIVAVERCLDMLRIVEPTAERALAYNVPGHGEDLLQRRVGGGSGALSSIRMVFEKLSYQPSRSVPSARFWRQESGRQVRPRTEPTASPPSPGIRLEAPANPRARRGRPHAMREFAVDWRSRLPCDGTGQIRAPRARA